MFYAGKKEAGQKRNTLTIHLQRDQVVIGQMQRKHLQLLDIILNSIFITFQGHLYENAGLSVYNIRGSQALLEEIDPEENTREDETDEIESPTYVNVNMTHVPLKMLWKYKLQNTANDILDTEFKVCNNFVFI